MIFFSWKLLDFKNYKENIKSDLRIQDKYIIFILHKLNQIYKSSYSVDKLNYNSC